MQNETIHSSSSQLSSPQDRLTLFLEEKLATLGYELVALEVQNHRERSLRIYIDSSSGIGIDDCVKVTQELDQPLESQPDVEAIFKGPYELEVSSPGINRPLRKPTDYERFVGQIGRLSTFRPLTGDETKASDYSTKNPKQKNFYGVLRGFDSENTSVVFGVIPEDGTHKALKKGTAKKSQKKDVPAVSDAPYQHETLIRIPLGLIAKAHLEPQIEYPED